MDTNFRILACLKTIIDLLQGPGWDRYLCEIEQRQKDLAVLKSHMASSAIRLYVTPSLASAIHMTVKAQCGPYIASAQLQRLLEMSVYDLNLDYTPILEKATRSSYGLRDEEFYEIMGLVCAEALNADAFITRQPEVFQRIIDQNYREFSNFRVPIMKVESFVESLNDRF